MLKSSKYWLRLNIIIIDIFLNFIFALIKSIYTKNNIYKFNIFIKNKFDLICKKI